MSERPGGSRGPGGSKAARWAALVLVVALAFGLTMLRRGEAPSGVSSPTTSPTLPAASRRETRPTLDPAQFVGKAAEAHRVAREIPDVLDQLYCYCGCDKHQGHKSLLSCYTDGHAAT